MYITMFWETRCQRSSWTVDSYCANMTVIMALTNSFIYSHIQNKISSYSYSIIYFYVQPLNSHYQAPVPPKAWYGKAWYYLPGRGPYGCPSYPPLSCLWQCLTTKRFLNLLKSSWCPWLFVLFCQLVTHCCSWVSGEWSKTKDFIPRRYRNLPLCCIQHTWCFPSARSVVVWVAQVQVEWVGGWAKTEAGQQKAKAFVTHTHFLLPHLPYPLCLLL